MHVPKHVCVRVCGRACMRPRSLGALLLSVAAAHYNAQTHIATH